MTKAELARNKLVDEMAALWVKSLREIERIMGAKIESVTVFRAGDGSTR